ncbi:MAG: LacI family DNA-binding transcriptional regulator [Kineosporiaceae bacterium]|nr:LacI family DNA-binding transcriptional regulator [Aeromicrobium sp.]
MRPKRATIYDVAELSGLSHQTVSRYLRHNGGLKSATAEKVQSAIEALNYRPNTIARSMRTRRTGRVAILMPAAMHSLPLRLMSAVSATAHLAGYAIDMLGLEGAEADRVARAQELADSGEFEGILAIATLGNQPIVSSTTPVVIIADYDDELHGTGALADGAACAEIVKTLVDLGHTHILHVAGAPQYASARNRRRTFVDTTSKLGVSGIVADGDWLGQSGYDAIAALPADSVITAVVAANDTQAMGAIRAARDRGWRVPEDLSVFGWDDNELCRFTTPSLSTVAIDRERQGRQAMEELVALIQGSEPPVPDTTSLHTVVKRESIGPPPRP